jgi:hypothetical protein
MRTKPEQQSPARLSPLAAGLWGFALVLAVYIVARALIG